jgi:hypothetical protein
VTLLDLTSTPTAARAGLAALTQIMLSIPSMSLQLSIADQIERLMPTHTAVCQSLAVDFLVALKARPIRQKILSIVERLVTAGNAVDIAVSLVRQLQGAGDTSQKENEQAEATEFMRMLLQSLRVIAASQPATVKTVYEGCNSIVADADPQLSFDTMLIVRDTVQSSVELRPVAICHLENLISAIRFARVARAAVYLLSLYSQNNNIIDIICDSLSQESSQGDGSSTTTVVLGDGTYVQRTSHTAETTDSISSRLPHEPYLIAAIGMSLARLCIRLPGAKHSRAIEFLKKLVATAGTDHESRRIGFSLAAMEDPTNDRIRQVVVNSCEESFNLHVSAQQRKISVKPVQPEVTA